MIKIRLGVVFPRNLILLLVSTALFIACTGQDDTLSSPASLTDTPLSTDTATSQDTPDTPSAAADTTVAVTRTETAPGYNLPLATLTYSTGLYVSPNHAEPVLPAAIPAGETVYVMGRNATATHLRVVFGTGVGWIPLAFTDYYDDRPEMLKALHAFTRREPPTCAQPIMTRFSLNSTWTSDKEQRIAVVVDLFRSRYGDFAPSFLSLTVNGEEIESTRHQIVERGQLLLRGVVFTLSGPVQPDDTVGYFLDTTSDEPVSFMATIFNLPINCYWAHFFYPMFPLAGVKFHIEHLREQPGEQTTETVSYVDEPGLDNSSGTVPLKVQIQFERNYRYQIIERLTSDEASSQRVRDMIAELYWLPSNDPEGTIQTAMCPVSIEIPPGKKATITVEWTELWADGVIIDDRRGSGDRLGTYSVFLGYTEPCNLISQDNVG